MVPALIKKFKLGDCLRSILSVYEALNDMVMDKGDITIKQKHILLNGLICIDMNKVKDDECDMNKVVCNNCMMQAWNGSYKNIRDRIIRNRIRFNRGESLLLYIKCRTLE